MSTQLFPKSPQVSTRSQSISCNQIHLTSSSVSNSLTYYQMSPYLLLSLVTLSLYFVSSSANSTEYDGFYDLSAKDTAYLCSKMPEYKKTGKQPELLTNPHDDPPKEKYMGKANKCWKMQWNPCEEEDIKKTKPCGWYAMTDAPEDECN